MKRHPATHRQLQRLKGELSERLERIRADQQRRLAPLSADFSEQAVERENDEVIDRLRESTSADLEQVQTALARIEQGQYGRCEQCGQAIATARLVALPQATRCSRCAGG